MESGGALLVCALGLVLPGAGGRGLLLPGAGGMPLLALELPSILAAPPLPAAAARAATAAAVGGGVLALLLLLAELRILALSSALTLNVIGHCKDVVAIGLSVTVLHEAVSPMNAGGMALTLAGKMQEWQEALNSSVPSVNRRPCCRPPPCCCCATARAASRC
jgi:hypothetical protein